MAGDYVPHSEATFQIWARVFVEFLEDHAVELGLTPEQMAELHAQQAEFESAHANHITAQNAAKAARADKDAAKKDFTANLRRMAMMAQASPSISSADRRGVGLSTGEPRWSPSITQANESPYAIVDISSKLCHTLRIRNRTPHGVQKARPVDALGCELWRKVGEAPEGFEDMEYIGLVVHSPFILQYPGADGGKQAHYALRWISTKGERSTWSEIRSATIAA